MEHNLKREIEPLSHVPRDASAPREGDIGAGTPRDSPSPKPMEEAHSGASARQYAGLCTLREEEFVDSNLPLPAKHEEEAHGYFHWEIDNWMQLPERAVSQTFSVGGHEWDILLFPRGNNASESVSLYIEHRPKEKAVKDEGGDNAATADDEDWYSCAMFCLAMSNADDPEIFKVNTAQHRFTTEESDWGFTRFSEIRHLISQPDEDTPPLIDGGRVRISAYVRVIKDKLGVLWHSFHKYNSRKVTGYVGLRNQGATCYMNSLLQSLYFTNEFRNAVYQIPTEADDPEKSVALALQRVFHSLRVSNEAVDTTELTKSFGWDSLESFMQHDVQEFNRVLQDNLETKMKGTVVEGAMANLFEGKMKSYIRCVNVDYESSRVENYYDISLNVKGCATLRDSFANYCEVETLNGENKYQAEGFGLQDAKKGVIFESFPPVLQLQLKRFEYDFRRDAMVKINDRHEFPPSIDLGEFLSDDADRSMSWRYVLHGVLVHSGDLHGGHYFGLLRPTVEEQWYRFDDDRVMKVAAEDVFEEYYGGSFPQQQQQLSGSEMRSRPNSKRFTNAYMLVYIREALRDRVLNPGDTPVPDHLLQRIQREKDEEARRQLERQHIANTLSVKVADDENFTRHQGFDLCYFDQRQAQDNTLFCERLPKSMTLGEFKKYYAEKTGKKESDFRLWSMVARVNKTVRCDVPLLGESMAQTLSYVKDLRASKWPDLRLYCEMRTEDSPEDFDAKMPIELSMIHIRFYDPSRQQLTGMGRMYVHANQLVQDIKPQLREAAVLPPDAPITLYEEVKPSLIDKMDVNQTFRKAEIQSGDIICFQVSPEAIADVVSNTFHLETVDKFFDELQHRVCVRFVPRPARNNADEFGGGNGAVAEPEEGNGAAAAPVLLASSKSPYDSVAQWLAGQLGMRDPLKLRFYTVGPTGQARQPVRRMATTTLVEMLPNSVYSQPPLNAMGQPEYTVMFERLEVDILQIDSMRAVRVTYVGRTMKEELQLDVLVPRTGPSQKLIEATYVKVDQALRNRSEAAPMPFALRTYVTNCH
ncbi:ubiquitin-specific protease ubp15, partial [Coemansia sp. RSA 2322]